MPQPEDDKKPAVDESMDAAIKNPPEDIDHQAEMLAELTSGGETPSEHTEDVRRHDDWDDEDEEPEVKPPADEAKDPVEEPAAKDPVEEPAAKDPVEEPVAEEPDTHDPLAEPQEVALEMTEYDQKQRGGVRRRVRELIDEVKSRDEQITAATQSRESVGDMYDSLIGIGTAMAPMDAPARAQYLRTIADQIAPAPAPAAVVETPAPAADHTALHQLLDAQVQAYTLDPDAAAKIKELVGQAPSPAPSPITTQEPSTVPATQATQPTTPQVDPAAQAASEQLNKFDQDMRSFYPQDWAAVRPHVEAALNDALGANPAKLIDIARRAAKAQIDARRRLTAVPASTPRATQNDAPNREEAAPKDEYKDYMKEMTGR